MFRLIILQKPFGEGSELQFLKECHQGWYVRLFGFQFFFVELDGHLQVDGSQRFRHQSLFCKFDDVFLLFALQLVGMCDEVFHTTVFAHQYRCRLLADAWNARDVVGGIAPEAEDVDELFWVADAVAFAHLFRPPHLGWFAELSGLVEQDFVGHQLSEVLVGGHHIGGEALLFRLFRQGADDVVGLVAFHAVDGDVEGLDEPYYIRYGVAEVVGHLLAVGLVFAVFGLSLCGAGHVEGHADVSGSFFL